MAVDKLVDSTQLDADLTSVANAIRAKSGGSGSLAFPSGFVSEIGNIPSGGSIDWDGYEKGTWPTGAATLSSSITSIRSNAFRNQSGVTSISAPEATSVGDCGIYSCTNLESVDLPKVTKVGATSGSNTYAIYNNKKLSVLHLPACTQLVGAYSLQNNGSSSVPITIVFPALTTAGTDCFRSCITDAVDLGPNFATIPSRAFYSGTYPILILRRSSGIVALASTNSLSSNPGIIYIPKVLYDELGTGSSLDYLAATNWSSKGYTAAKFAQIEGSIYETKYADGTAIPT